MKHPWRRINPTANSRIDKRPIALLDTRPADDTTISDGRVLAVILVVALAGAAALGASRFLGVAPHAPVVQRQGTVGTAYVKKPSPAQ